MQVQFNIISSWTNIYPRMYSKCICIFTRMLRRQISTFSEYSTGCWTINMLHLEVYTEWFKKFELNSWLRQGILIKSNLHDHEYHPRIIIFKEWYCRYIWSKKQTLPIAVTISANLFHQVSQLVTMYKSLIPGG